MAVTRARDFEHALELANNSDYGLTELSTRPIRRKSKPPRTAPCRKPVHQRKCTGAMVGVHPFGGFNMSGTDSKAGGPDYLFMVRASEIDSDQVG